MNTQHKLEFFGKEGFLNVNSPVNYGIRTGYVDGLNNLSNLDVYDDLIAKKKSTQERKDGKNKEQD